MYLLFDHVSIVSWWDPKVFLVELIHELAVSRIDHARDEGSSTTNISLHKGRANKGWSLERFRALFSRKRLPKKSEWVKLYSIKLFCTSGNGVWNGYLLIHTSTFSMMKSFTNYLDSSSFSSFHFLHMWNEFF